MKNFTAILMITYVLTVVVLAGSVSSGKFDCGVCNSKAISLPAPEFSEPETPSDKVSVAINIDKKGNVTHAVMAAGRSDLKKATETAAKKARFRPFIEDGQIVSAKGILIYSFRNAR
jgi:hypothetical protein